MNIARLQSLHADAGQRNLDFLKPSGPGWGTEVNEAAVRAHPPRPR
jgi:hypothetical protein